MVLHGVLASTLLHSFFQTASGLEMLVLSNQLLPLGFTALQEEGFLALLYSRSLLSLHHQGCELRKSSELFFSSQGYNLKPLMLDRLLQKWSEKQSRAQVPKLGKQGLRRLRQGQQKLLSENGRHMIHLKPSDNVWYQPVRSSCSTVKVYSACWNYEIVLPSCDHIVLHGTLHASYIPYAI